MQKVIPCDMFSSVSRLLCVCTIISFLSRHFMHTFKSGIDCSRLLCSARHSENLSLYEPIVRSLRFLLEELLNISWNHHFPSHWKQKPELKPEMKETFDQQPSLSLRISLELFSPRTTRESFKLEIRAWQHITNADDLIVLRLYCAGNCNSGINPSN